MSLHGTIETFALPDVLALLAATKKSGELRIVGERGEGRLWFDQGRLTGQRVGPARSFVDAVFELFRLKTGEFDFDGEKSAPEPTEPTVLEPILAEAQARLAEWREIESVIPSLAHAVRLASEAPSIAVHLRDDQWRLIVGVAGGRSVDAVVEHLDIGEFDTCRGIRELVESGLAVVEEPAPAPARAAAAPARQPEPQSPPEPEPSSPRPDSPSRNRSPWPRCPSRPSGSCPSLAVRAPVAPAPPVVLQPPTTRTSSRPRLQQPTSRACVRSPHRSLALGRPGPACRRSRPPPRLLPPPGSRRILARHRRSLLARRGRRPRRPAVVSPDNFGPSSPSPASDRSPRRSLSLRPRLRLRPPQPGSDVPSLSPRHLPRRVGRHRRPSRPRSLSTTLPPSRLPPSPATKPSTGDCSSSSSPPFAAELDRLHPA